MALNVGSVFSIVLPTRRKNERGTAFTSTFRPQSSDQVLTVPAYREHLTDLFTTRQISDSRVLLKELFKQDPDVSAAVNAYLTTANTDLLWFVRDVDGNIDHEGHKMLQQLITRLTSRFDYSKGFKMIPSLRTVCENFRYMLLLRGGIGAELVFDKLLLPTEIRNVDLATIEWFERNSGQYTPQQRPPGSNDVIVLDIPTFFVSFFRRDPTTIYTTSQFVSSINTIAARQQVINDLYRIMQKTGYPRLDVTVLEEVLRKNAPANLALNEDQLRQWMNARLAEISTVTTNLRPDQTFVHFDSVEASIINQGGPAKAMDVTSVIEVLNSQNQAALKTMATIIGRGESGVNTASVEASIFSKNAEELNHPIAEILSQMMTLALRIQGFQGYVECKFAKVDLRPDLELEPQRVIKQARYLELLSHGLISDDDFHIAMFNRIRPDDIAEMSGTGFMTPSPSVDIENISPNSDPLGRSVTPSGSKQARSNGVRPSK